jgi:DNA repair protein RecO (recombination protein O)
MLVKTQGIILRQLKYGETSLIVDLYSRDLGLQSYLVQGVRKPKSRMPGSLFQVMTQLNVVAYHHDRPTLKRLKEVTPSYWYQHLHLDIRRSAIGLFMVEVLRNVLSQAEPYPLLFDDIIAKFIRLDEMDTDFTTFLYRFLLDLSAFLGFQPGGFYSQECPFFDMREGLFVREPPDHPQYLLGEKSQYLGWLLDQIPPPPAEQLHQTGKIMLHEFMTYYRVHIDQFREPHSQEILRQVFAI